MSSFAEFFSTSAGMLLRRWELAQMDALLAECAGETALQLGAPYGSLLRNASHDSRQAFRSEKLYANFASLCQCSFGF